MDGHSFQEQSLWSERQGLVGRQQPHSDHMASAGVKNLLLKRGDAVSRRMGEGSVTALPEIFVKLMN